MEIYLLRHGESEANQHKLVCGALDYPLSKTGVDQAEGICRRLSGTRFDRIYTSALQRAIKTIECLDNQPKPAIETQLNELNTGDVSNITLPQLWEMDERFRSPWLSPDLRYPGGETFREMVERISSWFEKHLQSWGITEKILIVGHEGTLRSIYLKLMGLDLNSYPNFPIGNCDYLYFALSEGRLNQFEHVHFSQQQGAKL